MNVRDTVPRWLLVVLVLAAIGGDSTAAIVASDQQQVPKPDTVTVAEPAAPPAIAVDGPDKDVKPDDALALSPAAQDQLEKLAPAEKGDLADDQLDAGATPEPSPLPLAAQTFPGCQTAFVRNQSSRNGSPIRIIVWHYTVSSDRGTASRDALTAMSNSPANGVSWHFSIGRKTGACAFNVPLSAKAWTQANANPFSVGIEVVALGNEGRYVEGAGKAKLLKVTRRIGSRVNVPMQEGKVVNCVPVRSGIVRHIDLGACGGGHHDTTPFPTSEFHALVRAAGQRPITSADRKRCRELKRYRARRPRTAHDKAIIASREKINHARGLRCSKGKVTRR